MQKRPPKLRGPWERGILSVSLLEKAIRIAVEAHQGQKQKNGMPYILHPLSVMQRVETEDEKIVAVLHDVIEDTRWTFPMLKRRGFPKRLLDALDCVTKRDGQVEDYPEFILRSASNPIARRVKLADLEDNLDLRRLPKPTKKDFKRLAKYSLAREFLRKRS
jgi:(p)ppGpp synthase/HD superfamily hydrolase